MWDHGILIESARITSLQGLIAGLCGGVAMALGMAALSRVSGDSPWYLPKRLAGIFLGPDAKNGGPGTIAFGFLLHAAFSAGFGVLFALIADRLTHEFWMTGLGYALTLWLINFWGAFLTKGGREMSHAKWAWLSPLAHLLYGGVMAAIAVTFAASTMGA